jgi:4a-hydroxytetrahydrobiopterin dehydratase
MCAARRQKAQKQAQCFLPHCPTADKFHVMMGKLCLVLKYGKKGTASRLIRPRLRTAMAHTKSGVLSEEEIAARVSAELPKWRLREGHLCRVFHTGGWRSSMMIANAVAHLAEAAWHHPDLIVSYPKVEVRLQTHDAGGITSKDFELATKIEAFVLWDPAKEGGALTGLPHNTQHAYVDHDKA